ncbi:hypothetical protein H8K35_09995 [Undibacterium sp. LX40W]|uniref:Uncharacterized protein n=1 Tax=Undibacterium nitidum TaxID=2762298 RepID=A0A923KT85_9BURK|nr:MULTISPECIES: hypothetical protein [Undibacterium]MBC3882016.1 hypothetical protein [Undibacterium nitidum]MBC3891988.1 hypothetical protein [Undibacterium sp. LX40W]
MRRLLFYSFCFITLLCASLAANAGSKPLVVAFFDFSKTELGTKSFKAMRDKNFEHPCWRKFVEIDGIESVQFDKFPKALDRTKLIEAVHGSAASATEFAKALSAEGFNGAYAFVMDASGTYATIYGISYQSGAISAGASVRKPASGLIDKDLLSKALCEASRALD